MDIALAFLLAAFGLYVFRKRNGLRGEQALEANCKRLLSNIAKSKNAFAAIGVVGLISLLIMFVIPSSEGVQAIGLFAFVGAVCACMGYVIAIFLA